jgi:hypothetical protein
MSYDKMVDIENIIKWEDKLDRINGYYGSKQTYCIFCESIEYNSQVGIVHKKDCIIQEMRDILRNKIGY